MAGVWRPRCFSLARRSGLLCGGRRCDPGGLSLFQPLEEGSEACPLAIHMMTWSPGGEGRGQAHASPPAKGESRRFSCIENMSLTCWVPTSTPTIRPRPSRGNSGRFTQRACLWKNGVNKLCFQRGSFPEKWQKTVERGPSPPHSGWLCAQKPTNDLLPLTE